MTNTSSTQALALVVAALSLAATGIAHAQPSDGGPVLPQSSAPRAYVSAGLEAGADSAVDWVYGGTALEGGYHLRGAWWLHGEAGVLGRTGSGPTNNLMLTMPTDNGYNGRIGAEARGCSWACWYGGADVGYRTGTARGAMFDLRGGIDLGTQNLRFRPGVEVLLSHAPNIDREVQLVPLAAIGLTTAVAYVW
jgi:hypothetical protein